MAQSAKKPANGTVLVIDDNEPNRLLAQATLEGEGHRVVLAANGDEGLGAFSRERPDCVLLDIRMPGMDGFQVCERIRTMETGADVPILFLTAQRDVDTFDRAQATGADDFLTKPIRPSELITRVQLALKLHQLGGERRELTDLVRRLRDDISRVQLQKERLSAFLVHDLKGPVGGIDLHAQVIMRDKALSDESRSSATHIRTEARQLNRLILNLLDIAKGEEGKLIPQRTMVELRGLAEQAIQELEVTANAREVRLKLEATPTTSLVDPDLIRRTLSNLLENAIRHAPRNTDVTTSMVRDGGWVTIRVADRGKGIPAEMRERVFDHFVQVDGEASQVSRAGRGLGLAFCKMAVESHGGTIRAEDGNPGAVFSLRLEHAC